MIPDYCQIIWNLIYLKLIKRYIGVTMDIIVCKYKICEILYENFLFLSNGCKLLWSIVCLHRSLLFKIPMWILKLYFNNNNRWLLLILISNTFLLRSTLNILIYYYTIPLHYSLRWIIENFNLKIVASIYQPIWDNVFSLHASILFRNKY